LRFANIRSAEFMALFLGNRRCHSNRFAPYCLAVILMLSSRYEVDWST